LTNYTIQEEKVNITVQDIMSRPAIFIDPDSTVARAATLMRRREIRSLLVSLRNNKYGIITTTDIRDKIVATDMDPKKTKVREIMTSPLATASPTWSLKECSVKMMELGVHHLPVTDRRENIVGMISAIDIFMSVEESGWEASV
jgi:CBS domain-containing protein